MHHFHPVDPATSDRIRVLTERGYIVNHVGCIAVGAREYSLALTGPAQSLVIRDEDGTVIRWSDLLPRLKPRRAPRCKSNPERVFERMQGGGRR